MISQQSVRVLHSFIVAATAITHRSDTFHRQSSTVVVSAGSTDSTTVVMAA